MIATRATPTLQQTARLHNRLQKMINEYVDGVLAVNKPKGMSSAQLIRDWQSVFRTSSVFEYGLKREAKKREQESRTENRRRRGAKARLDVKIGHGGTLDPLASGVLILGLNHGTKSLAEFLHCKKTYETVVVFGASSDSGDRVGKLLKTASYAHITRDKVTSALTDFSGTIVQTPPLFSAIKMNGKPLYEYARSGLPIPREIPSRKVTIESVELLEWYKPGTHRHFWPREQASDEEKQIAQKVEDAIHGGGCGSPATPLNALNETENGQESSHANKRKAEEEKDEKVGGDMVYEAPSKKPKLQQSSPVMSGALPSASDDTHAEPTDANSPVSQQHQPAGRQEEENQQQKSAALSNAITIRKGKGSDLIPEESPEAPPPWEGIGPPAAKIRMVVSSGFYVRSFCHDLGEKVGSAALMAELVRTQQADFSLGDNVLEYSDITKGESVWGSRVIQMLKEWTDEKERGQKKQP